MNFDFQNRKDFKDFLLATILVLACFLGYVFHSVFFFGQFIFLILLVINPLLFGYISKRPIMSFLVGFLPLFLLAVYRLRWFHLYPTQFLDDFILLTPGALLLGTSGFFAARIVGEKKFLNFGISVLFILIMISFYLFIYL